MTDNPKADNEVFCSPATLCAQPLLINGGHERQPSEIVLNSSSIFSSREEGIEMMKDEEGRNFSYQRYGNLNVLHLEKSFCCIENASYSIAVSSGMTAISLIIRALLSRGNRVVTFGAIFYESLELLHNECEYKDARLYILNESDENIHTKINNIRPDIVFAESIFNPSLKDINIRAISNICKNLEAILIIDNSLMTPLALNPLSLGATVTIHSLTKHISGHGDVIGGMVSTHCKLIREKLLNLRNRDGLILNPFSAWLTLRGLRTLAIRLKQHANNADEIYSYIKNEKKWILISSTAETEFSAMNELERKYHSGLLTLDFKSSDLASYFAESLKIFSTCPTFGNIESSCFHYGSFVDHNLLNIAGISPGLIRLSVGIEDVTDLLGDIQYALNAVEGFRLKNW